MPLPLPQLSPLLWLEWQGDTWTQMQVGATLGAAQAPLDSPASVIVAPRTWALLLFTLLLEHRTL